jgi:hypothetical protein
MGTPIPRQGDPFLNEFAIGDELLITLPLTKSAYQPKAANNKPRKELEDYHRHALSYPHRGRTVIACPSNGMKTQPVEIKDAILDVGINFATRELHAVSKCR